jgi:ubiquinone/menaquinone biosynthesis C-methylase UbiE
VRSRQLCAANDRNSRAVKGYWHALAWPDVGANQDKNIDAVFYACEMTSESERSWLSADAFSRSRRGIVSALRGSVLELGPGRGLNFGDFSKDIGWTGLDQSARHNVRLRQRALEHGFRPTLIRASAEAMPVANNSFDAVIASDVLCSVKNPNQVLSEIIRVLRPGGFYCFFEHVVPLRGGSRTVVSALAPLSIRWGKGCDPSRDSWRVIENAGFAYVDMTWHLTNTFGVKIPRIGGIARRR